MTTATRTQDWSLDPLGNWGDTSESAVTGVTNDGAAQTRKHNKRNQLTEVAGNALTFDSNGNTTKDETGKYFIYDAWNRLKRVNADSSGATPIRTYAYDGLGRRISDTVGSSGQTTNRYYNASWQEVEERIGNVAVAQNVWSQVYIDALVARDYPASVDGSLDTSFSSDGKHTEDMGGTDAAHAVGVDSFGRIVVGGYSGNDFALARYNTDGTLDAAFDGPGPTPGDGKFAIDFANGSTDKIHALAIDSSNRIIVAGESNNQFVVARLTTTGALDNTFNTTGKVTVNFGGGTDIAYALAIQPDGKIVVAGKSGSDFALARLTTAGALDNTFDSDGKLTTDIAAGTDAAYAVAVHTDGSIVAAGVGAVSGTDHFAVPKYSSTGVLDANFDGDGGSGNGKFTVAYSGASAAMAQALVVQPDGKVVLGGWGSFSGASTGDDFILMRLTAASGAKDTTFGTSGQVKMDFFDGGSGTSQNRQLAMSLEPLTNKILAAGYATPTAASSDQDFAVMRYNGDGTTDSTFGDAGRKRFSFGTDTDISRAIAIDPSRSRLVMAGESNGDFALAVLGGGSGARTVRTYAHQDANFNTTLLVTKTGTVIERYVNDPYGSVTVLDANWSADPDNSSDHGQPFLWQGGRLETATGVYHFRNRDVSPTTGRAMQPDPIGYADSMNLYQWERSTPLNMLDPHGTYPTGFYLPPPPRPEPRNPNARPLPPQAPPPDYDGGMSDYTPPWWEWWVVKGADGVGLVCDVATGGGTGLLKMGGKKLLTGLGKKGIKSSADDAGKAASKNLDEITAETVKKNKHTPGKGHQRKSQPKKRKKFQKQAEAKREAAKEECRRQWQVWEDMNEQAQKMRPELKPKDPKPD